MRAASAFVPTLPAADAPAAKAALTIDDASLRKAETPKFGQVWRCTRRYRPRPCFACRAWGAQRGRLRLVRSVRSMRCVIPRVWKGWVHERGGAVGLAADFFRSLVNYAVPAGPLDRQGRDGRAARLLGLGV